VRCIAAFVRVGDEAKTHVSAPYGSCISVPVDTEKLIVGGLMLLLLLL